MVNIKKILIAVLVSLTGIYLISIFILLNLPYHAFISRADRTLRSQYGTGLIVGQVSYRYPFKMYMRDVRIVHEDDTFVMSFDDLLLKLKLISFSGQKSFEINGSGIGFRSQWIDISGASVNLVARIRLFPLIRGVEGNHVTSLRLVTGGADVERVLISGFELRDLRLKQVQLFLNGDVEGFSVERGVLSADVVKSDLEGRLGFQNLDMVLSVILTEEFYNRYGDLRTIIDSFFKDGMLKVKVQGSIANPRASILR
jgi:hypothetical protein